MLFYSYADQHSFLLMRGINNKKHAFKNMCWIYSVKGSADGHSDKELTDDEHKTILLLSLDLFPNSWTNPWPECQGLPLPAIACTPIWWVWSGGEWHLLGYTLWSVRLRAFSWPFLIPLQFWASACLLQCFPILSYLKGLFTY